MTKNYQVLREISNDLYPGTPGNYSWTLEKVDIIRLKGNEIKNICVKTTIVYADRSSQSQATVEKMTDTGWVLVAHMSAQRLTITKIGKMPSSLYENDFKNDGNQSFLKDYETILNEAALILSIDSESIKSNL